MATLKIETAGYELSIVHSNGITDAGDELITGLVRAIEKMHAVTPLESVSFSGPISARIYQFETVDGRTWRQAIDFSDDIYDPKMTFDEVQGAWKLSEFAPHRHVRNAVIQLCAAHSISSISVAFE